MECNNVGYWKSNSIKMSRKKLKPDALQGAALIYDRRGWTLNGWGKYGHNIQAGFSSKFGLWLNSWHSIGFWHRMNVV